MAYLLTSTTLLLRMPDPLISPMANQLITTQQVYAFNASLVMDFLSMNFGTTLKPVKAQQAQWKSNVTNKTDHMIENGPISVHQVLSLSTLSSQTSMFRLAIVSHIKLITFRRSSFLNASSSVSHDDFRPRSQFDTFDECYGIGSWGKGFSKRPASGPLVMETDLLSNLPSEENSKDTQPLGYVHEMRRGHDQLEMLARARREAVVKSVHLNSSDDPPESAPSLTADLSTVETGSVVEDEHLGERSPQLYQHISPHPLVSAVQIMEMVRSSSETRNVANPEGLAIACGTEVNMGTITATDVDEDSWMDDQSDSAEELWLSDYSEDGCIIEEDHPVWREHGMALLNALLFAFQKHQENCHQESNGDGSQNSDDRSNGRQHGSGSNSLPVVGEANQNKRSYSEFSADGENGSSASMQTSSKGSHPGNKRRLLFACPFCKKDTLRYRDCYSVKLTKISYVKQHLSRNHSFPIYCSLCMQRFETEHARDIHTRAATCQRQPLVDWEGVTEPQKQQLRKKPPKNTSEEDQWFMIFKILFPGHPLPVSPYIDGDLSEQLFAFQDFAVTRGPEIVGNILGPQSQRIPESEVAPFLERVFSEGLPAVVQQFLVSRQFQNGPRSDVSSSWGLLQGSNTTSSENNDISNGSARAELLSNITLSDHDMIGNGESTAVEPDGMDLRYSFANMEDINAFELPQPTGVGDSSVEYQAYFNEQYRNDQTEVWFNNEDR